MKSWYEDSRLWSDINNNITDIKRIYFTGGEPTINHKHKELLEKYNRCWAFQECYLRI